jgi:uncharacterized alkaline shock family protein YloU
MNVFTRLQLTVFAFVTGLISIIMIGTGFGWIHPDFVNGFIIRLFNEIEYLLVWELFFALLLLLSIRFFFYFLIPNRREDSIDQRTDFGDVRISLETIEALALKAAGRFRGVKDIKARIKIEAAGLQIFLKFSVEGTQSIPELSEEMQKAVQHHVEEITGLSIQTVTIYITGVAAPSGNTRARVE